LRVVAPQMMACTWVAAVLAEFGLRHPEIHLRITDATADDVVATVRRGDVEVGIGPERPAGDDVTRVFLMNVPMRLVCAAARPAALRSSVSWKALHQERWVSYSTEFNRFLERSHAGAWPVVADACGR
jgi:DNA-binding transcriptional LysR family regulator